MKEENYLEGIYGCLERIEKKVETLPVEGTSPAVGNRTSSPEGIAELKSVWNACNPRWRKRLGNSSGT